MNYEIVSGGVYPEFAKKIADSFRKVLLDVELKRFANGERYVRYIAPVREKRLFIFQTFVETDDYSLNDAFMELLLLVDAAKRASAKEIVAVLPIMPYARGDRIARDRESISVAVIMKTLKVIGVDRIITIDLHSLQTQAVFDGPFDHLRADSLIIDALKQISTSEPKCVIVAPDAGRMKESEFLANMINATAIFLPKTRHDDDNYLIDRTDYVAGVDGKTCIIIDDMIDTGGTILSAAKVLKKSDAKKIVVIATHGILSDGASARMKDSGLINELYVTNTIKQDKAQSEFGDGFNVIDVSTLIIKAIQSINDEDIA